MLADHSLLILDPSLFESGSHGLLAGGDGRKLEGYHVTRRDSRSGEAISSTTMAFLALFRLFVATPASTDFLLANPRIAADVANLMVADDGGRVIGWFRAVSSQYTGERDWSR